ncbi:uroporphyrinogen-III synthase [Thiomicrorhabdus sp. Milos-T2]|uniref:uroporphyrinogen-III synthase n=1 Tax=Thiomicrorhabdus sp. Milos-T2 TaxID=90814 RepID=UPI000493D47D|nr:uroporphyrinogen-III synthase [Thiomicrorhabdus sp. Milos-T2]
MNANNGIDDLSDFTLLNTRPAHQASQLSALFESYGGQVISCPLIEIEWLDSAFLNLNIESNNSLTFDKVIFTSANAVEGWCRLKPSSGQTSGQTLSQEYKRCFLNADLFAIGRATQAKGETLGLTLKSLSLKQFDSEHFLAHTEMHSVDGQQIALVKGAEGRTLIADTLTQRGANVQTFDVYQRQTRPFCVDAWERFLESKNPVLLITSLDSWHKLLAGIIKLYNIIDQQIMENSCWSKIRLVVVMSQRIANHIQQDGFNQPISIVKSQSNQGIIEAINDY